MTEADVIRLIVTLVAMVSSIVAVTIRVGGKIDELRTEIALGRQASEAQAAAIQSARAEIDRMSREGHESRQELRDDLGKIKERIAVLEDRQKGRRGESQ